MIAGKQAARAAAWRAALLDASRDARGEDPVIRRRKTLHLLDNIPPSLIVALINAGVLAALAFWLSPDWVYPAWWALIALGVAARFDIARRAQNAPDKDRILLAALDIATAVTGLSWASILFLFPTDSHPVLSYAATFMLAGMSAGAALSFATHLRMVLAFNLPLMIAAIAYFLLLGGAVNAVMAGVVGLYFFATTALSLRAKRMIETALHNQLRAERQAEEIGQLAASLETAVAEARAASQAKSQFLANMSHELRTPLNGVIGMAQLLETTELSGQQADFARTIRASGRSLLALVENVLDLARLEAGQSELQPNEFEPDEVLASCLAAASGRAEAKGLALKSEFGPDLDQPVYGDERRLRQLFGILLGNAVKYTQSGQITLSAARLDSRMVRIEVSDTGPGLDPQMRARVFERFTQADDSDARRHGGAGLGLSIAKEIVDLFQGAIGVDEAPGGGARFWVELPLPASPDAAPIARRA